jgi:signal transduction histidine kinase
MATTEIEHKAFRTRMTAKSLEWFRTLRRAFAFPAPFGDPTMEADFRAQHLRQFAEQRFTVTLVGLFAWFCYLGIDLATQADRDYAHLLLGGRLAAAIPVCWITWQLRPTQESLAEQHSERLIQAVLLLFATSHLWLTYLVVPFPEGPQFYLAGFYVLLIATFAFTHLLSRTATAAGVAAVAIHYVMVVLSPAPRESFFASISLPPILALGHLLGVQLERYDRQLYDRLRLVLRDSEQRQQLIAVRERERDLALKTRDEKAHFMRMAAHDLRQSLAIVRQRLLVSLSEPGATSHSSTIHECANLIEDSRADLKEVLHLAELESGNRPIAYQSIDLAELLLQLKQFGMTVASTSGGVPVAVHLDQLPEQPLLVRSEALLLQHVFQNLIANSIKYADQSKTTPKCTLKVIGLESHVRVDIEDNGIGIDEANLQRIFEPFVRLNDPRAPGVAGHGLGLAIVAASIRELEGHGMEIRSTRDLGTTFSIDLPRSRPRVARTHAVAYAIVLGERIANDELRPLLDNVGLLVEQAADHDALKSILELQIEPDFVVLGTRGLNEEIALAWSRDVAKAFGRKPCVVIGKLPNAEAFRACYLKLSFVDGAHAELGQAVLTGGRV